MAAPRSAVLESRRGTARLSVEWQATEVWRLSAHDILATEAPGLMPLALLSHFDGRPEPVLRECRRVIEARAAADEQSNLLAVSQVFAKLRYNDPRILTLLGGRSVMIESPLIRELVAETRQRDLLGILRERFGAVPPPVEDALRSIQDEHRLDGLFVQALRARDLDSFSQLLAD